MLWQRHARAKDPGRQAGRACVSGKVELGGSSECGGPRQMKQRQLKQRQMKQRQMK